MQNAYAFVTLL